MTWFYTHWSLIASPGFEAFSAALIHRYSPSCWKHSAKNAMFNDGITQLLQIHHLHTDDANLLFHCIPALWQKTATHWIIFPFLGAFTVNLRDGCVRKVPVDQKHLDPPVWHQQRCHFQNHLNHVFFSCSDWTLAGCLDHVCIPKCINLLPSDWLTRDLR